MPGEHDPDDFWMPMLSRFNLLPWDMCRVRVSHYDSMLTFNRRVPVLG